MKALLHLPLALAVFMLAACTTTNQQSRTPLVLPKLQAMGIDSGTYNKIANHRVLTYGDIYGLVKKGVPSPVIQTYLQSTKAPYTLTNAQLQNLVDAGASADLVNYLGKSVGFFEATERSQTGGAGKWKHNPFFADPYFWGPAPFDYAYPGEWFDQGWVDDVF